VGKGRDSADLKMSRLGEKKKKKKKKRGERGQGRGCCLLAPVQKKEIKKKRKGKEKRVHVPSVEESFPEKKKGRKKGREKGGGKAVAALVFTPGKKERGGGMHATANWCC